MTPPHEQQSPDAVTLWLKESNQEFFGTKAKINQTTVTRAIVGFVVLGLGVGLLLWQVL